MGAFFIYRDSGGQYRDGTCDTTRTGASCICCAVAKHPETDEFSAGLFRMLQCILGALRLLNAKRSRVFCRVM